MLLQSHRRTRRAHGQLSRESRRPRVEVLEQRRLLASPQTFMVTNASGDPTVAGSLGFELALSNANGPLGPNEHNTINFAISGSAFQKISLTAPLSISVAVLIDGTTQGGPGAYAGTPNIEVDGTGIAGNGITVLATAAGTAIKALAVDNFSGTAIVVSANNTLLQSNFIGIDPSGAVAKNGAGISVSNFPVGVTGVTIGGTTQQIGSSTVRLGNVITGNTFDAIDINGGGQNLIQGNLVGTNKTGTAALGNAQFTGINLTGTNNNTIGGTVTGAANVIGQFIFNGIELSGSSTQNLVVGNFVGTDVTGTLPLNQSNGASTGIAIDSGVTGNTVGGTTPQARNVIAGNGGTGVSISGPNNLFQGNYVGVGPNNVAVPNVGVGVAINVGNVTIGGIAAGAGNVISGNQGHGITVSDTVTSGVLIAGNMIGVDFTGTTAVPNGTLASVSGDGILVSGSGVTIGAPGAGNTISGNIGAGIEFAEGSSLLVQGNLIGTDAGGGNAIGNGVGILFSGGSAATVGGTTAAKANVISGNVARANAFQGNGIQIDSGPGGNLFLGNLIGTDVTGQVAVPNEGTGVVVGGNSSGDTIGGTAAGYGNVISGNGVNGIATTGSAARLTIQGNAIGTTAPAPFAGAGAPLGNGADGVRLATSGNLVGGTVAHAGNVIAYNGAGALGNGIHVVKLASTPTGNVFQQNSIYGNAALGIGLSGGGITPTPIGPPATPANPYANNHINYPIINQAIKNGGVTTVSGVLTNQKPNTTYNIEYFQSPAVDASGFGEGWTPIGTQLNVQTDSTGSALFTTVLGNAAISPGQMLSATATDVGLQDGTSEFSKSVPIQAIVDVSIVVTANPMTAYAGQPVTFFVTVTNQGTTDAHNVSITNALPNNISPNVVAFDNFGGSPALNGNVVTDIVPVLVAGQSARLTIQVIPTQLNVPSMTDSAQVGSSDQNSNSDTSDSATVNVQPVVPLRLTVTPNPNPGLVGQTLSYIVTLQNLNGTAPATGVVFTDVLDPNVVFDAAGSSPGLNLSGSTLTKNVGTIGPGQTVTITINVTPLSSAIDPATGIGFVTNAASEAYNESASDPNDPNAPHSVSIATPINPVADVSVVFVPAPSPNPVNVGQPLTYTILVTNSGPSTANDIVLTDLLDANVTFVPGASTPGWNASGQTLTMTVGQLAAGGSTTVTIVVTPNAAAVDPTSGSGSVNNTVSVSADEVDLTPANSVATVDVDVKPLAVLTISGSADPDPVSAGADLVYTFIVTNTGPSTANNVIFTDAIPANTTFVSATSTQGLQPTVVGNVVIAQIGILSTAPNTFATITITVRPNGNAGKVGTVTNTASVTATEAGTGQPPTATVVTNVTPSADVAVSIQATPSSALVGSPLTYVITVSNSGPSDATDVTLTDTRDPSVILGAITPSQGSYSTAGQVVTADFGTIAAGETATLRIVVTPHSVARIGNSTTVANTPEPDPNLANNTASLDKQVFPSADLSVQVVGGPNSVLTGAHVLYTATVSNHGPSTATNVKISDRIPNGAAVVSVVTSSGGSFSVNGGVVTGFFPNLAPGASASITIDVITGQRGVAVDTATVSAAELDPNPANNVATTSTTIFDPPGTFDFLNPVYTVNNNAGFAAITVVRTNGVQGNVKVQYTTTTGSAQPGLDYAVTSGTLEFADGVLSQTFFVPIHAFPFNRNDIAVGLTLSNPNGGAVLGPQTWAQLNIHVLDPDITPPTITNVTWSGVGLPSSAIVVGYGKPMNAATAANVNNYQLVNAGPDSIFGTSDDSGVAIASASYDSVHASVVLVPAAPLRPNTFYHLVVNGSSGSPVTDFVGNVLAGNGAAGTDGVLYFASGANLNYMDANGNRVNLRLTGGGTLNLTRFANGQGNDLQIVGEVPHRTRLVGTLRRAARTRGTRTTSLSSISGLGNFGDVRVRMSTPPFYVAQKSFSRVTPAVQSAQSVKADALHSQRGGAFARKHR